MPFLTIARDYLVWHYSRAYIDIVHIWWNYLWFVNHVFSVPEVAKSWFSPFKRMQEDKVNIIKSPSDFFANMFVNLILRMVGICIRTSLLTIALLVFALVFLLGLAFLLLWTVLPLLIGHFGITSVRILFL
jgi:hypothetical protein